MAAGDSIPFALTSMSVGGSAKAGIRSASLPWDVVKGQAPAPASSAGSVSKVCIQKINIDLTVMGTNPGVLRALVGAAAAAVILAFKGGDGSNRTLTLKAVAFHSFTGPFGVRDPDTGGLTTQWGITGSCVWLDADTVADMWVDA